MPTKLTVLFTAPSAISSPTGLTHRIGGWSESYYHPSNSLQTVLAAFNNPVNQPGAAANWGLGLGAARAGLLGLGANISGYRIQNVAPLGPSQSAPINFPGQPTLSQTVPQAALLAKAPGVGVLNIRRFILRGIPTGWIAEGELNQTPQFIAAWATFVAALNGWSFKGRDLSQPRVNIVNVTAAGVVNMSAQLLLGVGSFVRVLKTKDSGSNLRGGLYQVSVVGPGALQTTLLNWQWGATTGGSMRIEAAIYPAIDTTNMFPGRIVTRRVGRPFTQYRGRRSKRR